MNEKNYVFFKYMTDNKINKTQHDSFEIIFNLYFQSLIFDQ